MTTDLLKLRKKGELQKDYPTFQNPNIKITITGLYGDNSNKTTRLQNCRVTINFQLYIAKNT